MRGVIHHNEFHITPRLSYDNGLFQSEPDSLKICSAQTAMSPKASAQWLDQSCSGPKPMLRMSSFFSWYQPKASKPACVEDSLNHTEGKMRRPASMRAFAAPLP